MKKLFAFILCFTFSFATFADEGMWLLLMLGKKYEDMKKMGFKLTAEDIYSVNKASMKDAIVRLGRGFCTGEMVSKEGLFLTNHHCGYDAIQSSSTTENDYLTNGFYAMTRKDEIRADFSVSFLIRMEDVTAKVLAEIKDDMTEAQRNEKIRNAITRLTEENNKAEKTKGMIGYETEIRSFFGGNEYYMLVYETFKDVRLVAAPPESIGKFGGDTDNWMWPRHTGDFSMFRVYANKDNKSAEYAADNVPFKPRHHFPVSLKGVQPNDFTMVFGFPGGTSRYLTSQGVSLAVDESNPTLVRLREKRLAIMKESMDKDKAVRLKYASKYANIANYWKFYLGETKGLKQLKVYDRKKEQEKAFQTWVEADATRKAKYGETINLLEKGYAERRKYEPVRVHLNEALFAPEIVVLAAQFQGLLQAFNGGEQTGIEQQIAALKEAVAAHFKDYDAETDKKIMAALYQMYADNVAKELQVSMLKEVLGKYGSFEKFADEMFKNSLFASKEKVEEFFKNPSADKLKNDLAIQLRNSILENWSASPKTYMADLDKGNRLFIAGWREMNKNTMYYPDANSTPRLTYGKVGAYKARDAVNYDYMTYIEGIMEKEDPENPEFIVPAKMKELYKKKDYGQYAFKGTLPVAFITNNDITGGNSGSPVINAQGHLIGIAFDGNWEAMSGKIAFEPNLQRCINVDIRFVLFCIDKLAGAKHLVDEMTIIR